jgi:hypothetical protein
MGNNNNTRSYLFDKYNMMYSTEEILKAYKHEGHRSINIIGEKGVGKTCYAMVVMAQVFRNIGNDADTAWDLALDHLLFAKDDVISFLKTHAGDQAPVFCWDDLRAYASGMSYVIEPRATVMLLGLIDTIRDSVCGFLTTSPSMSGVLSFIAKDTGYQVIIRGSGNNNEREANIYYKFTTPTGQPRRKNVCTDIYPRFLPADVYQKVKDKRSKYKELIIKNYEAYLNRKNKSNIEVDRYKNEIEKIKKETEGNSDDT